MFVTADNLHITLGRFFFNCVWCNPPYLPPSPWLALQLDGWRMMQLGVKCLCLETKDCNKYWTEPCVALSWSPETDQRCFAGYLLPFFFTQSLTSFSCCFFQIIIFFLIFSAFYLFKKNPLSHFVLVVIVLSVLFSLFFLTTFLSFYFFYIYWLIIGNIVLLSLSDANPGLQS